MSREIKLMQMITAIEYYVTNQPLPKQVEQDYREILKDLREDLRLTLNVQANLQEAVEEVRTLDSSF